MEDILELDDVDDALELDDGVDMLELDEGEDMLELDDVLDDWPDVLDDEEVLLAEDVEEVPSVLVELAEVLLEDELAVIVLFDGIGMVPFGQLPPGTFSTWPRSNLSQSIGWLVIFISLKETPILSAILVP